MPKRYLQGIIDESTYNSAWRIISHNLHLYLITALYQQHGNLFFTSE
ncbi:hypothetical protein EDWATA_03843 [Edwardsiella tarda ATCC 23685]|uniref:Uncharacterized protein n=1 Tax=Edwardsiella tarda ATCC 23685 TaxID=500638 RepID=D4FAM2_EDWTA|nr:hypothetical protein EDWATA_03843 [Edwardsiella tarda ATCC 23685]